MKKHIKQELDWIKDHPKYSQFLRMAVQEDGAEAANAKLAGCSDMFTPSPEVLKAARNTYDKISWRNPHNYPHLAKSGSKANDLYGLAYQEQLSRLMEYLFQNGRYELVPVQSRGSCMYAAIRRTVNVPAEYTNVHLRRQIVMTVLKYSEFLLPVPKEHTRGIFGHARLDMEELGSREREGLISEEDSRDQKMQAL